MTHQHYDHNRLELPAKNPGCVIWQNTDALQNGVYQTLTLDFATAEAVEAYNHHHPKAECVGYIVTADGVSIYFAGDTGETEEMAKMAARNLDYAVLPMDYTYTMDIDETIRCAKLIGAKHTIPVHIVGIAVPDHIVRREDIHTSAVLVPLFLLWGVFDIFEHDGFLLLDRRMQDVHGIIDGLVACFYLAVHKEAAPEALSLMGAYKSRHLSDQLTALFGGDKPCCLHRIHQQLQLGKLQVAGADEEFVLPATVADHIKAAVLQLGSVLCHRLAGSGDAKGSEICYDIRRGGGMLLIGVIPQVFEDI